MMSRNISNENGSVVESENRRDFLILSTVAFCGSGLIASFIPLISSFGPSKDVMATSTKEVSLATVGTGTSIKVTWQGKPVFIRNRTEAEVKEAKDVDVSLMRDPELDSQRTKPGKENWLVVVGVCTHLGCVPLSQNDGSFYCPCHGSYYDTSGRIVKGPAPKNLLVPEYSFVGDKTILIGKPGGE